jgi:hypothetical protein
VHVIELLGYLASAVIIASLTMRSFVWLRIVGLVGAVMFAVYGLLVEAIPVVVTNAVIIGLHSFFLWRAYRDEEFFTLLEVQPDSRYLHQFLEFHRNDIARFQPGYTFSPTAEHLTLFILRDMVPAGLFIGRPAADAVLEVELDYVIPQFRDLKAARFLFGRNRAVFLNRGATRLHATAETEAHRRYLLRVGFEPVDDGGLELRLPV